ncbi:MAG: pirin family protein [Bdellovibrionaceae bacterium]|nr:pirin family protein [Pseudobdellovibrionaceae bacterium]MBX3033870.1 pirin family protein [Pseudobdellovibrionaceae bacterium]
MAEDLLIQGRLRDIGGFAVHRSLPSAKKRQLGPFVFLDHMGPVRLDETHAMDVRPHPHIGLATVTYLFEGRGFHRDTLGSAQMITAGDLNWMTAGRGIAHSERTPEEDRHADRHVTMHGVQIWVGLPAAEEEREPSFAHWPKSELPLMNFSEALDIKILLGEFAGRRSPVEVLSPILFLDLQAKKDGLAELSFGEKEIGFFLAAGTLRVNGQTLAEDDLLVAGDPSKAKIEFTAGARMVVIGGEPFPEPRHIWWNFVSSRKERIHQAAADWQAQRFGRIDGESDFTPLPTSPPLP